MNASSRGASRWAAKPTILAGVTVVSLLGSCAAQHSNDPAGRPVLVTVDPTSTDELSKGGGTYIFPVEPSELPDLSDLAIVVTVEDVLASKPNTLSGLVPPVLVGQTEADLLNLSPITPVVVKVHEVLGLRPASEVKLQTGTSLTLELPGGVLEMNLTFEQVQSLGIEVPAEDISDLSAGDVMPYFIAVAPSVSLAEGQSAVVFLVNHATPFVSDDDVRKPAGSVKLLQITHGSFGVFHLESPTVIPDDLRRLGKTLNESEGPAIEK
jgi:hypothetical protein